MDCSGVALGVDVENSFLPKVWQNLASMVHLDFESAKGSPHVPEMLLSPLFQDSCPKSFLLSSPEPLHTLLSLNRSSPGSPAGASQMCFIPALKDIGQNEVEPNHNFSPQQHGCFTRDWQISSKSFPSEQASHRKNSALNQTWTGTVEEMEEGLMIQSLWHLSQHVSLANRAGRLQQRVLAMLGEHASRHYSHQLESLKKKLFEASSSPCYSMTSEHLFNALEKPDVEQAPKIYLRFPQTHKQPLKSRDLQDFESSGRAVLQGLLEGLDSDATVSSSDEEWDHEDTKHNKVKSRCGVCEGKWLKDRAELCSRWTWLQMRLSELDSQIQLLGKLQQQILSSKGHVVLAESQPLTDRQIQHTLWTETMDLSFTAGNMQDLQSDLEMEPSSPTRLLRNIERQSAQLSQIVNSLMPSLCASPSSSPVSKGPCNRRRGQQKTAYSSGQYLHKSKQKKKRTCHKQQYFPQVDVSCMSARTRPLLTYHKPRLFILSHDEQVPVYSSSIFPSCPPCDPSCTTDPVCPHKKERTKGKVHPVLSLPSEIPSSSHLQNALFEESVLQRHLLSNTEHFSPLHCVRSRGKVSRSLFHCSHRPRKRRRLKGHRWESTPIREHHSHHRRHCFDATAATDSLISSITPESDVLSRSDDSRLEESSEDMSVSYSTPSTSQFPFRRRNCESSFSFDDIVVPMSLFASRKVERLQYENILTPSWRKVNISPLLKKEQDELGVELSEAIEDEDFIQRHWSYERREKLRWSSWDPHRGNSIRSSRKSVSSVSIRDHSAHGHSPVHSLVRSSWTFSPPSKETSVDEREPLPPWTRRLFPLTDEDEETLRLPEHQSKICEMDQEVTSH